MFSSPVDSRAAINATTLSNKTPGAKPWYVPARTTYVFEHSFTRSLVLTIHIYICTCRCIYSLFVMHRRTDLWGPDGKLTQVDPQQVAYHDTSCCIQRPSLIRTASSTHGYTNTSRRIPSSLCPSTPVRASVSASNSRTTRCRSC